MDKHSIIEFAENAVKECAVVMQHSRRHSIYRCNIDTSRLESRGEARDPASAEVGSSSANER